MEDKKTIILKLAAQGMNSSQTARETGFSRGSVYYYMHPEKYKKQEIPLDYRNPDASPGWNADRKKCKSCRYRQAHYNPTDLNKGNCNYIEIAGHSRGCAVEDCDRYVKGTTRKGAKMTNREAYERDCNELEQYREIGTVEECREAVENKKKCEKQWHNDMENPLEPIKVYSALKSEILKLELRIKNRPKDISILDYTVIAALQKVLENNLEEKEDE